MDFLSIIKYAELKGVTRMAIDLAIKRGDVDIDKSHGPAVIFLTKKNRDWTPSLTHQKNAFSKV